MKSSCIVVVLFFSMTFASCVRKGYRPAHLRPENGVDQHYQGRFSSNPTYQKLKRDMPRMRKQALEEIRKMAGLKLCDGDLVVSFRDGMPGRNALDAATGTREFEDEVVEVTHLYLEKIISGRLTGLDRILQHEFVHAAMRSCMKDDYQKLPKWFREGMAVWTAGQLPDRTDHILGGKIFAGKDPLKLINGIESGRHNTDDYMEDALLFEYLAEIKGKDAPGRLVKAVIGGQPPKEAFARFSGQDWKSLQDTFQAWAEDFVSRKLKDAFLAELQAGQKSIKAEKYQEALERFEKFIVDHPDSFLVPLAVYYAGKALNFAGHFEKALEQLKLLDSREDYRKHHYLLNDAAVQVGWSLTAARKYPEAIRHLETFLEEFPNASKSVRGFAYYRMGQALFESGQQFEAIRPLRKSVEHLYARPQEYCLEMLVRAYAKNNDMELARETYQKLEKSFPESKVLVELRPLFLEKR